MNEKKFFPSIPFRGIEPVGSVRKTFRLSRVGVDGHQELIQTGEEDLSQVTQSFYKESLDYVLDRFLEGQAVPTLNPTGDFEFDQSFLEDKLDLASAYVDNMEEARDALGLDLDVSYDDIRNALEDKYNEFLKGVQNNEKTQTSASSEQSDSAEA